MTASIVTGATEILGQEIVVALSKDENPRPITKQERGLSSLRPAIIASIWKPGRRRSQSNCRIRVWRANSCPSPRIKGWREGGFGCTINGSLFLQPSSWHLPTNLLDKRNAPKLPPSRHPTGAFAKLKRVLDTTGAKRYDLHLGPLKMPMLDPISGSKAPPACHTSTTPDNVSCTMQPRKATGTGSVHTPTM